MYHSLRVLWLLQHKTMSVKDRKHWAWIAALIFHVCSELLLNRSRRNRTCTRNWNFKSNDIIIFHENLIDIRCLYSPFQSDVFFFLIENPYPYSIASHSFSFDDNIIFYFVNSSSLTWTNRQSESADNGDSNESHIHRVMLHAHAHGLEVMAISQR